MHSPIWFGTRVPAEAIEQRLGRFDQSFFVRSTVSFLVLTLVVAALEIGLRFGLMLHEFHRRAAVDAQVAAERLADDVRSIMINRGGPVASQTVYPILQRTLRRNGLEISIEPYPVTVTSIPKVFAFEPRGISPNWPAGIYREGHAELRAEEFCLRCHVDAKIGDVLGTVNVRDYLRRRLDAWWEEVRLTAGVDAITIVVHTVILFFLLRALLAPLLTLRAAVARLARGASGLSIRAPVGTSDEFGELAHDLNVFLDRIDEILADLERTVVKMVRVSTRLFEVTARAKSQLFRIEGIAGALPQPLAATSSELASEVSGFRHFIDEIGVLEEHLQDVVERSRLLLERLVAGKRPAPALDDTRPDQ